MEMARCLLNESRLPKTYWGHAILTANYIRNRVPSSNNPTKSPHELLTGRKPDLSHLRVFGPPAVMPIDESKRTKLDEKGLEVRIVGFTNTGYLLVNPKTGEVHKSAHVKGVNENHLKKDEDEVFYPYKDEVIFEESETTRDGEKIVRKSRAESCDEDTVSDDESMVSCCEEITPSTERQEQTTNEITAAKPEVKPKPSFVYESTDNVAPRDINLDISTTNIIPGKRTRDRVAMAASKQNVYIPKNAKDALSCEDAEEWKEAMKSEITSLIENHTWDPEPVSLPSNRKAVGTRWVFTIKINAEGKVEKYKARLVAQGYSQVAAIDYDETYSPVSNICTLRILLHYALQKGYRLSQADIVTAYLYSDLDKEIYITEPQGLQELGLGVTTGLFRRLRKALYGLKQSGLLWNRKITSTLLENGFVQSSYDRTLFMRGMESEDTLVIVLVYVDDLVIVTADDAARGWFMHLLQKEYKVKDLGDLRNILGINVTWNDAKNCLFLNQSYYIETKLKEFGQSDAKTSETPMTQGLALPKQIESDDRIPYQSAIGSLLYASRMTRPDIAYSVGYLGRFNSCYGESHWSQVKKVFRYLKNTADLSLGFQRKGPEESFQITAYCDASFGGDLHDRKSTTGFLVYLGGNLILWRSTRQRTTALSSCEAEIDAASSCVREIIWMQGILRDLRAWDEQAATVFEDNQCCIAVANGESTNSKVKHIGGKTSFLQENVKEKVIKFIYCPTESMTADALTKPLGKNVFRKFCKTLGLQDGGSVVKPPSAPRLSNPFPCVGAQVFYWRTCRRHSWLPQRQL
jgi:hypothetical protein